MSAPASDLAPSRHALRRALWRDRGAMPRAIRAVGEQLICAALARTPWLRAGSAIGLYVSRGTEVSTLPLRTLARRRGCRVYLPRITDFNSRRMVLLPDPGPVMALNRYRIAEPSGGRPIRAEALAVAFIPLVGFDDAGNRLGNGAGFYDRLLSGRIGTRGAPVLVGIAFECQRRPTLPAAAHDVPLDAVITERGVQIFKRTL